jgi:hypothetical protein
MEEVRDWLHSINMFQYCSAFETNGWDSMASVRLMDLQDVENIVPLSGHARLISSSIPTTVKQVNYPSVSTSSKPGNPSSAVSGQNKSKCPFSD